MGALGLGETNVGDPEEEEDELANREQDSERNPQDPEEGPPCELLGVETTRGPRSLAGVRSRDGGAPS